MLIYATVCDQTHFTDGRTADECLSHDISSFDSQEELQIEIWHTSH